MPGRHNKVWTPQEDAALRELIAKGLHPQRIAIRLRRTSQGVRARAAVLGLKFKTAGRRRTMAA